jgi:microcompartment protein CcmL/EutN
MPREPLGIIETASWTAGIVAADVALKAAPARVVQAELNDMMGVVIKLAAADVAGVRAAVEAGAAAARAMGVTVAATVIPGPGDASEVSWRAKPEYNPLIEQDVVHIPQSSEQNMSESTSSSQAIGILETQGFAAVIEAIDAACKAANVDIVGREKLGGGYVSVVVRGDVAAVKAAVEAGKARVEQLGLGKLIAAHVIARPTPSVLGLLPKA